jgi:hypothetical protein
MANAMIGGIGTICLRPMRGVCHVAKKELVGVLQVLLGQRRLQIADLPERDLLAKELLAFKVKVTVAGNETLEVARAGS